MTPLSQMLAVALEHHRAGRLHEAKRIYREILQVDPNHVEALHLLGMIATAAGKPDDAIALLSRATALRPKVASYHGSLGLAYQAAGQADLAIQSLGRAVHLNPASAEVHNNLGVVLRFQGRLDEAAASFRASLNLQPDSAETRLNLGETLFQQGKLAEAITCYREALLLRPMFAEAHYNLGVALQRQGDLEAAQVHWREAERLKPRNDAAGTPGASQPAGDRLPAEEYFRRGFVLAVEGRLEEAAPQFQAGLVLNPLDAQAWHRLGNVLLDLGQLDEAMTAYQKALQLQPDFADAYNDLGNALARAERNDEALAAYRNALACDPDHVAAHGNLGVFFKEQGKLDDAAAHFQAAAQRQPTGRLRVLAATLLPPVYDSIQHLTECRRRLVENLRTLEHEHLTFDLTQEVVPNLFYLAYQGQNDRDIQRDLARLYSGGAEIDTLPAGRLRAGTRIRVGILSKYLRNHTIGTLMRGLVATLSRKDFEVTALVFDPVHDPVADFIRQCADQYVVLPDHLAAARRRLAELAFDVLFYPDLGMNPLTYSLAFSRLAPVQCVAWGHPVTSGIPAIDYFLSSALIEPEGAEAHYTEKLVRLAALPFYYYRPRPPAPLKSRAAFGFTDGQHLYACLQTLFKFHPEFDALLAEILRRDPQGCLVLIRGKYPNWDQALERRLARSMPDVLNRVRWLSPMPRQDFLNLMALADVLLDTIHFGGGNTSYEGLALAIPIVTLAAPLMRGRITYAMYQKMGVLDCVATDKRHYVDLAVALGTDSERRQAVRARIQAASEVLFEDAGAVRELEEFFQRAAGA